MTGSKRIFLDSAPVIYYVQEDERYIAAVSQFFDKHMEADLFISVITRSEFLVAPLRKKDDQRIQAFFEFLESLGITTSEINEQIADAAAKIRAAFPAFKLMDALQLATAEEMNCTLFLTNDKQLRQYESDTMQIVLVDDLKE